MIVAMITMIDTMITMLVIIIYVITSIKVEEGVADRVVSESVGAGTKQAVNQDNGYGYPQSKVNQCTERGGVTILTGTGAILVMMLTDDDDLGTKRSVGQDKESSSTRGIR